MHEWHSMSPPFTQVCCVILVIMYKTGANVLFLDVQMSASFHMSLMLDKKFGTVTVFGKGQSRSYAHIQGWSAAEYAVKLLSIDIPNLAVILN